MITRETLLTPELRELIEDALRDAIESDEPRGRAAHTAYLDELYTLPTGSPIGDLIDVVEYFALDDDLCECHE